VLKRSSLFIRNTVDEEKKSFSALTLGGSTAGTPSSRRCPGLATAPTAVAT
jgi:hypothetical protein